MPDDIPYLKYFIIYPMFCHAYFSLFPGFFAFLLYGIFYFH